MEQELYGEEAANFICQLTGWSDALEIRDDGVFVKDGYLANDPGEQAFTWTPACEMDWHGAPDPLTAPALPIPFTASELAAFILDAAGYGIQSRFGWIECGLDEGELERLSIRATKVRKALKEAYRLAQRAQCVAGEDNHDEQQRAADLLSDYGDARSEAMAREKVMERLKVRAGKDGLPEYGDFDIPRDEYLQRLARTNESVATQKAVALKAKAEADKRHVEWRKAMVNELLKPTSEQAATRAPATGAATPALVVTASDGPAKHRRRTWRDVSETYLEFTYKELQCPTVKDFFRALLGKAGADSPFDKGCGQNFGSLFARDVSEKVTIKMIERFVTELRKKM